MIAIGKKQFGINAFALRLLGFITMVMGAFGYVKGLGYDWLEAFGWMSFAIFAFLLSEGVNHTTDRGLYLRRFIVFAALTEVVYDFMKVKKFWYWRMSSAMATLMVGLIILLLLSYIKRRFENLALEIIAIIGLGYLGYWFTNTYNFAFGGYGIIVIIMFFVAREVTYTKITQCVVLFYISYFMTTNVVTHISLGGIQYPIAPELYMVFALPFIWLYDDTRGPNALILQILQYLSYGIVVGGVAYLKYFI